MLDVKRWAELRREHFVRGVSINELVRRTGLARNTIRSALRSDVPPGFRCPERPSKLDGFKDEIDRLLERDPRLPGVRVRRVRSCWSRCSRRAWCLACTHIARRSPRCERPVVADTRFLGRRHREKLVEDRVQIRVLDHLAAPDTLGRQAARSDPAPHRFGLRPTRSAASTTASTISPSPRGRSRWIEVSRNNVSKPAIGETRRALIDLVRPVPLPSRCRAVRLAAAA